MTDGETHQCVAPDPPQIGTWISHHRPIAHQNTDVCWRILTASSLSRVYISTSNQLHPASDAFHVFHPFSHHIFTTARTKLQAGHHPYSYPKSTVQQIQAAGSVTFSNPPALFILGTFMTHCSDTILFEMVTDIRSNTKSIRQCNHEVRRHRGRRTEQCHVVH